MYTMYNRTETQNKTLKACSCHPSNFHPPYQEFLKKILSSRKSLWKSSLKLKPLWIIDIESTHRPVIVTNFSSEVKGKKRKNFNCQEKHSCSNLTAGNLFYIDISSLVCASTEKYRKRSTKDYYLEKNIKKKVERVCIHNV